MKLRAVLKGKMTMKNLRIVKNVKGQSIVEFALVAPILLLLVFGIIEFGRVYYNKALINHAARNTLRIASVGTDISGSIQKSVEPLIGNVAEEISEGEDDEGNPCTKITLGDSMIVYITPTCDETLKTGDEIRISIYYTLEYITLAGKMFGDSVNLNAVYYTTVEVPPDTW